ncbi:Diacylglycerol kinase [Rhynchospora pubera]|uniref:Diacylglycerol kinase n=1 Tax=Rhynchospora pubera TaxID=906938 RepID=A0AAV8CW45_9POAL|nr:Diacylglycerol kinase [Rhynchospora pubera]
MEMQSDHEVALSSTLFLDGVGEVVVQLSSDGLSCSPVDSDAITNYCLGVRSYLAKETKISFSDVYAIEPKEWGSIYDPSVAGTFLHGDHVEMHRFAVHGVVRPKKQPAPWILSEYIFGHKDLNTCEAWVRQLNSCTSNQYRRPKKLLVLVHPLCGKGKGLKTWETVAPVFSQAKVETKVIVTERAGHAYDVVSTLPDRELRSLDGIVTVGGDGLFNEVLNGLLSSRHKASYPPPPTGLAQNGDNYQNQQINITVNADDTSHTSADEGNSSPETSCRNDDNEPLLSTSQPAGSRVSNLGTQYRVNRPGDSADGPSVSFPNDWFRLGLIPAGSTDAIVLSTTGVRDPVTSALHIILGSKMSLDIAQVVRWKTSPSSVMDSPTLRYAASFAGYGFYGDVIKESEKLRWMGPVRYDYAGTMVFLKHKTYEAEVTYLEPQNINSSSHIPRRKRQKQICRTNCMVCNQPTPSESDRESLDGAVNKSDIYTDRDFKWSKLKGRFLSIGAAVISCRNERAPDGLVADAHLSDGFLHLILVKDCPRPHYLWHLTQLTKRGSDPLNYSFIEHRKTPAFTFVSQHDRSLWNLDGEALQACQVSVQACRGLVNLFASGPEV